MDGELAGKRSRPTQNENTKERVNTFFPFCLSQYRRHAVTEAPARGKDSRIQILPKTAATSSAGCLACWLFTTYFPLLLLDQDFSLLLGTPAAALASRI